MSKKESLIPLTEEEKKSRDDLYNYIKKDILNYKDNMALNKKWMVRIVGLSRGQFMAKNTQPLYATYSFDDILLTFKMCKFEIDRAIRTTNFKDESHMINYIMLIIENNINLVMKKKESLQKEKEKAEEIQIEVNENKAAYVKKTKEVKSKILKDLW